MLQANPLKRLFTYLGMNLPDPNPRLTVEDVRAFYATQFPEIVTAAISGPEVVGDRLVSRLVKSIGTKG